MSQPSREVVLRFLASPQDVNFGGKVHGGSIMKWIDQAAYACASGWSRGYSVTAHIGDVSFMQPVQVGAIIEIRAKIIFTGNSSMHIAVGLRACDPMHCDMTDSLRCVLIFVAVDEDRKPRSVPKWVPETDEDKALEQYAQKLVSLRKGLHAELGELDF